MTTKILREVLTEILDRRPADPIDFIREHLRNSIRFPGSMPIIQAYNGIILFHWTTPEYQAKLAGAYDLLKTKKDANSDPVVESVQFCELMKLFLRDQSNIQSNLSVLILSWLEYETTVPFDVFCMGIMLFSLMEEYVKQVAVLYKLKAQTGLLPVNLLQETFKDIAKLNMEVMHDKKDGLRLYLSEKLFLSETVEPIPKFITQKEFEILIERQLCVVASR
ncbi:hypothetical protein HDU79_003287 [Rhizoclosmatium sp. JEL0117]|nr:hypothetical protein HDU79_003287 [Rhizoclosmatium sp. JEL0117]